MSVSLSGSRKPTTGRVIGWLVRKRSRDESFMIPILHFKHESIAVVVYARQDKRNGPLIVCEWGLLQTCTYLARLQQSTNIMTRCGLNVGHCPRKYAFQKSEELEIGKGGWSGFHPPNRHYVQDSPRLRVPFVIALTIRIVPRVTKAEFSNWHPVVTDPGQ